MPSVGIRRALAGELDAIARLVAGPQAHHAHSRVALVVYVDNDPARRVNAPLGLVEGHRVVGCSGSPEDAR